jgi:hypothetical protein
MKSHVLPEENWFAHLHRKLTSATNKYSTKQNDRDAKYDDHVSVQRRSADDIAFLDLSRCLTRLLRSVMERTLPLPLSLPYGGMTFQIADPDITMCHVELCAL